MRPLHENHVQPLDFHQRSTTFRNACMFVSLSSLTYAHGLVTPPSLYLIS